MLPLANRVVGGLNMTQQRAAASTFAITSQARAAALIAFTILAMTLMIVPAANAQTLTVLHNFTAGDDGLAPTAALTPGGTGTFYGTASGGGLYNCGVVFKMADHNGSWSLTPIFSFKGSDGCNPLSPVTIGPDGSLYGTTIGLADGEGTLYKLQPLPTPPPSPLTPWQMTLLHDFTGQNGDGDQPVYEPLIFDQAGNLYGTTQYGGLDEDQGTVWEATPNGSGWTESVVASFDIPTNGPFSNVGFDDTGNLYGTTGDGTAIFELSPSGSSWTTTILHTFKGTDGTLAYGGLIKDQAGNLYGASSSGGTGNDYGGVVYELTPNGGSWNFQVIYNLPGLRGPFGNLTLDAAGNLYGVGESDGVNNRGMLFKLSPNNGSWSFTDLFDFNVSSGCYPLGSVVFDASGNIYGTTQDCGKYEAGTVWEFTP